MHGYGYIPFALNNFGWHKSSRCLTGGDYVFLLGLMPVRGAETPLRRVNGQCQ